MVPGTAQLSPAAHQVAPSAAADLFRHVSAEKAPQYRAIMDVFAAAKRQFRLHLRPDEVLAEAQWTGVAPPIEEIQQALAQLTDWGNLQAQPDTARVATIEDFNRKRLLFRLTAGGEAAEAGLAAFMEALAHRGELQSVALEDILTRLSALQRLTMSPEVDAAKVHEALRDLMHVFRGLADNAEAFMAGLARTIELQRADAGAVISFKTRLIDYLERFIGDLVARSSRIAAVLLELDAAAASLLRMAAEREARDAAPADAPIDVEVESDAVLQRLSAWRERWNGLKQWFISDGRRRAQSELLRANALSAIPRLLQAVATLNERRAGRSDRAADFRRLALWFAEADSDADAHRLWRAAFALSPARHLSLVVADENVSADTSWMNAPPVVMHPQLRQHGQLPTRGPPVQIRDRSRERAQLAAQIGQETVELERARRMLCTGRETHLSELGRLDASAFRVFLSLLGEALAAQAHPDQIVERLSGDGTLSIRLEPLSPDTHAVIDTEIGRFSGRDHRLLIAPVQAIA